MARGAESKSQIMNKILDTFDGAFLYNDGKEIRIPLTENGEQVQIKVTLTCAKDNVVPGADNALPGTSSAAVASNVTNSSYHFGTTMSATVTEQKEIKPTIEPTAEEKANVKSLLEALGL